MKRGAKKIYIDYVKPLSDRLIALILVIVCSPLFILVTVLLSFLNKGRVIFLQKRVGKNHQVFYIFKFRTMNGDGLTENGDISGLGNLFRKLSIDELPQLINVLKGEMSLVGPRPLLVEYIDHYNEYENLRHSVKPGITGWAQVNGRNMLDWKARLDNDIFYVHHQSFLLDCKILLLTCVQLFRFRQADFNNQRQETFIEYAKRRR